MEMVDVRTPLVRQTRPGGAVLLLSRDWRDADPVRRCLEFEGYEVRHATTVKAALALLSTGAFGAILCDAQLGGQSGFEALAEVRRRCPRVWRLVVAGRESIQEMVTAMSHGTVHFCVARPVDRPTLLSTVRHALAGKCTG